MFLSGKYPRSNNLQELECRNRGSRSLLLIGKNWGRRTGTCHRMGIGGIAICKLGKSGVSTPIQPYSPQPRLKEKVNVTEGEAQGEGKWKPLSYRA